MCSDGRVTYPALQHAQCLATLDVLVIAGGLGTRIQSALGDPPKLLAPIVGRPYLAYLLDWLGRFGARRVVLGLGHRAQAVIEYLEGPQALDDLSGDGDRAVAARYRRRDPLCPADLRSDPVLIMNGDSFTDADLCAFVATTVAPPRPRCCALRSTTRAVTGASRSTNTATFMDLSRRTRPFTAAH